MSIFEHHSDLPPFISGVYECAKDVQSMTLPLVFDSPHSGNIYPGDFDHICTDEALKSAEDNMVDDLFSRAETAGAAYLKALFPRTYIDVNRAPNDIDPQLLCPQFLYENDEWRQNMQPSPRSHAGIGLIRRVLRPGIPVYDRTLDAPEIEARLENYYHPYHKKLTALLDYAHYNFGAVWHINCHSMPSRTENKNNTIRFYRETLADFVLGDRDGTSCDIDFTRNIRGFLTNLGYKVAINNPYRGVELIHRYSAPSIRRHSLQIEVNKKLYWDEEKNRPNKNYDALKNDIGKLVDFCAGYVSAQMSEALAAD